MVVVGHGCDSDGDGGAHGSAASHGGASDNDGVVDGDSVSDIDGYATDDDGGAAPAGADGDAAAAPAGAYMHTMHSDNHGDDAYSEYDGTTLGGVRYYCYYRNRS